MFPDQRRFLRFYWQGQYYQFNAMPFGLAIANNVYQTDGNYRKLPQKETDSGVYVSKRLADQEQGQSFAVNSIGRRPSVDSVIRSNCQQTEVQNEPVLWDQCSTQDGVLSILQKRGTRK
jgi:hypothetical protein